VERHERLRLARQRAGFRSAADAARRLGLPYGTYSGHESGFRGIKQDELALYAETFQVPLPWLAFGQGGPDASAFETVPVVGLAGEYENGGVRFFKPRDGRPPRVVPRPMVSTARTAALFVFGERLRGIVPSGSIVYFDRELIDPRPSFKGVPCICVLADGTSVIKLVYGRRGNDRLCDLESFVDPPLRDVELKGVAPLTQIVLREAVLRLESQSRFRTQDPLAVRLDRRREENPDAEEAWDRRFAEIPFPDAEA
jgi:hypothetical protein